MTTLDMRQGIRFFLETVKQLREFFPRPSLIGRFGGDEFMVLCPFSQKELLEETINHFMECTIPPYSVKRVWDILLFLMIKLTMKKL